LNLAEHSSGTYKGKLRISKRGKAMSRRWLYYAALRWVQDPSVRPWYEGKKARDGQEAKRGLVAVMRKLAKAVHAVGGRGVEFNPRRLFSLRRAVNYAN
jgi:transposase